MSVSLGPFDNFVPEYPGSFGVNLPPADMPGIWETFFGKVIQTNSSSYAAHQSYYDDLFEEYYTQFFNSLTPAEKAIATSVATTPPELTAAKDLAARFEDFLRNETDLIQRTRNPSLWVFGILLGIITEMQNGILDKSNRVFALTTTQKKATNAISNITFTNTLTDTLPVQAENQKKQAHLQTYTAYKDVLVARSSQMNNQVNGSNDALSQQNSLMSSLLQQVEGIVNNIFK